VTSHRLHLWLVTRGSMLLGRGSKM
jgi:hypothetical protein